MDMYMKYRALLASAIASRAVLAALCTVENVAETQPAEMPTMEPPI